jgi:hypothetical protein
MSINQRDLIFLILKGMLAWIVLSGLVLYFGVWLGNALFPLIKAVMVMMMPDLNPSLKLVKGGQSQLSYAIENTALVLRPIYLNVNSFIPARTELKSSLQFFSSLAPIIIELSIMMVWPVQLWSQRLLLIALGLLTSAALVATIFSSLLLGKLEIAIQEVALTGSNPRREPWFLDWARFCDLGGNWLLGIAAVWLCIKLQHRLLRW